MAKGSHTTWGDYDSRICHICGRKIVITRQAAWVHHQDGEHRSTHPECGSPLKARNMHDSHTPTEGAQLMLDTLETPDPLDEPPAPDPEPPEDDE